eukprot:9076176-Karenia_brevis.AAC.1
MEGTWCILNFCTHLPVAFRTVEKWANPDFADSSGDTPIPDIDLMPESIGSRFLARGIGNKRFSMLYQFDGNRCCAGVAVAHAATGR